MSFLTPEDHKALHKYIETKDEMIIFKYEYYYFAGQKQHQRRREQWSGSKKKVIIKRVEITFTLAIERTYTHQNEIENMYIQIFTKILLTCGKLHGILFLKKIFQGKLAEKQGRKARRD